MAPERAQFAADVALPSAEEVRGWWDTYCMLPNIRDHSEKVTQVAMTLCQWLAEAGVELNCQAVEVGALAHDIAKSQCLGTDKMHMVEGANLVQDLGFPELAQMVLYHVLLKSDHPLDEVMVVNYADKRVKHDRVVDLDDRFAYIRDRYGNGQPDRLARIDLGLARARQVEAMIFQAMGHSHHPDELFALNAGGSLT